MILLNNPLPAGGVIYIYSREALYELTPGNARTQNVPGVNAGASAGKRLGSSAFRYFDSRGSPASGNS
jgi:hypothetical protein